MKTYCVREKRKTECVPGTEHLVLMRNGREGVKCICASCGAGKFSIIPKLKPMDHSRFRELHRRPRTADDRLWQQIQADDYLMRRRPKYNVLSDRRMTQKIPLDHSRFRKLQRKPQTQWQKILADDLLMRTRNKGLVTPDERFADLMKQFATSERTRRAMKGTIIPEDPRAVEQARFDRKADKRTTKDGKMQDWTKKSMLLQKSTETHLLEVHQFQNST